MIFCEQIVKNLSDLEALACSLTDTVSQKSQVILLLEGDLGVGKTTFSQFFFHSFTKDLITSPSYTIMNTYDSLVTLPYSLFHIDLYRIDEEEDIYELGIDDIIKGKGDFIFIVEWASKFPNFWEKYSDIFKLNILIKFFNEDQRIVRVFET